MKILRKKMKEGHKDSVNYSFKVVLYKGEANDSSSLPPKVKEKTLVLS